MSWGALARPAFASFVVQSVTADGNRQSLTTGIARVTARPHAQGSRGELEFRLRHCAASLREGGRRSSLVPYGDRDPADARSPGSCRSPHRPACSNAVARPQPSALHPDLRPGDVNDADGDGSTTCG